VLPFGPVAMRRGVPKKTVVALIHWDLFFSQSCANAFAAAASTLLLPCYSYGATGESLQLLSLMAERTNHATCLPLWAALLAGKRALTNHTREPFIASSSWQS